MAKVAIGGVDNVTNPLGVHSVRKPVSGALGTEAFAMNYFELEPGESFSGGLHTHHDQEEVFYVQAGEATFEVGREREEVSVAAGECVRFAPGEFQTGTNESDERTIGFAIGAPKARHDFGANGVDRRVSRVRRGNRPRTRPHRPGGLSPHLHGVWHRVHDRVVSRTKASFYRGS
jgi:uncharacterized cupin superfamily protein